MAQRKTPKGPTGPNRRDFLKGAAAVGATGIGYWVTSRKTWADEVKGDTSPNEKVNVASIGVGGKGDSDSDQVGKYANLIAICDVDENTLGKKAEKFPKAKKFTDFRKMFDAMGKEIDAVTVSIPDHQHFYATQMAIKAGKHCYTQKPLTHDVWEARQLRLMADKYKVATQMGNQGTAGDKFREGVEVLRAGAVGDIKEVHVWTNRPIWPQAPKIMARPDKTDPVPETLHWDDWIGTAPMRPFVKGVYHTFNWRGWWDFGTGALGDMGCHTANLPFMALKLGSPTSLHGECGDLNSETYPSWATVHYEFPERAGMPPVKLSWWEGHKNEEGKSVKNLPAIEKFMGQKPSDSGSLVIGSKGTWYSPHDYGEVWHLLPEEQYKDFKPPEPTLPRNGKGDDGQKIEWLAACKGGPKALSNFDYAGMLSEFILLGNIGIRTGKKLDFDGPALKFTNAPDADQYLRRQYRKGWEVML